MSARSVPPPSSALPSAARAVRGAALAPGRSGRATDPFPGCSKCLSFARGGRSNTRAGRAQGDPVGRTLQQVGRGGAAHRVGAHPRDDACPANGARPGAREAAPRSAGAARAAASALVTEPEAGFRVTTAAAERALEVLRRHQIEAAVIGGMALAVPAVEVNLGTKIHQDNLEALASDCPQRPEHAFPGFAGRRHRAGAGAHHWKSLSLRGKYRATRLSHSSTRRCSCSRSVRWWMSGD
jgi:hypothetical protein